MLPQDKIVLLRERWSQCPPFNMRQRLAVPGGASPFGKTDLGLEDYRGCVIDDSLHKIVLERIDFSYCTLGKGQFASTVRRCLFVGAAVEGNIGAAFEDCDFADATLRNSILRGIYTRCILIRTDLSLVRSAQARFVDCVFDEASLKKASFFSCQFVRCSFLGSKFGSGSLAKSTFEECRFSEPNFSTVVLDGTRGLEWYSRM